MASDERSEERGAGSEHHFERSEERGAGSEHHFERSENSSPASSSVSENTSAAGKAFRGRRRTAEHHCLVGRSEDTSTAGKAFPRPSQDGRGLGRAERVGGPSQDEREATVGMNTRMPGAAGSKSKTTSRDCRERARARDQSCRRGSP